MISERTEGSVLIVVHLRMVVGDLSCTLLVDIYSLLQAAEFRYHGDIKS